MRRLLLFLLLITGNATHAQELLGSNNRTINDLAVMDSLLAVAADQQVELWDLSTKKPIGSMPNTGKVEFTSVCFGNGNSVLITGNRSGEVTEWNLSASTSRVLFNMALAPVTSVAFSPTSNQLAVSGGNGKLVVLAMPEARVIMTGDQGSADVTGTNFSDDGGELISAASDGRLRIYSGAQFQEKTEVDVGGWITAVSAPYSPGLRLVASAGKVWTVTPAVKRFKKMANVKGPITALDVLPGKSIAVATATGEVLINTNYGRYSYSFGTVVTQVRFFNRHDRFLRVAVATRGKGLILLDARNMKLNESPWSVVVP